MISSFIILILSLSSKEVADQRKETVLFFLFHLIFSGQIVTWICRQMSRLSFWRELQSLRSKPKFKLQYCEFVLVQIEKYHFKIFVIENIFHRFKFLLCNRDEFINFFRVSFIFILPKLVFDWRFNMSINASLNPFFVLRP